MTTSPIPSIWVDNEALHKARIRRLRLEVYAIVGGTMLVLAAYNVMLHAMKVCY